MDGSGMRILLLLIFGGAICGTIWLILLMIARAKNNKKLVRLSFIPIGIFALSALCLIIIEHSKWNDFQKIPYLEVKNNTVTVLNSGTGSMGSHSQYILTEEDADGKLFVRNKEKSLRAYNSSVFKQDEESFLQESDTPYYHWHFYEKFGYTFTAEKAGTGYVCILEFDCGAPSYLDIYKIAAADDKSVTAEKVNHIECNNLEKELPEKFSFLTELFSALQAQK